MINLEKLKLIYNLGRDLSLSDVQSLLNAAQRKILDSGEYLIEQGHIRREIFFIRKGLIRAFTLNEKGDEITTSLRWEQQLIGSHYGIVFQQPARFYYQALEKTEVFFMHHDDLQDFLAAHPKLEQYRKNFLQRMLVEAYERIESFTLNSPEERYLNFVSNKPNIVSRVPDKYIANVLGITPVSLSRIRKRIATRKQ